MLCKVYRYVRDLEVHDEDDAYRLAAQRELSEGEYFVYPAATEEGISFFGNGVVVQVNRDGRARNIRVS